LTDAAAGVPGFYIPASLVFVDEHDAIVAVEAAAEYLAVAGRACESSNNFAERCTRPVAAGRKAFRFVGSERAGHAVALYDSPVESCMANKVTPLTHVTNQAAPS
jgi:hypothetical protein